MIKLRVNLHFIATVVVCVMLAASLTANDGAYAETLAEEKDTELISLEHYSGESIEKQFSVTPDKGNVIKIYIDNREGTSDVRLNVEKENGKITSHSPIEKGSDFTITLAVDDNISPESWTLSVNPVNGGQDVEVFLNVCQSYEYIKAQADNESPSESILINLCEYKGTCFKTYFECSDYAKDTLHVWIDNSANDSDLLVVLIRDDERIQYTVQANEQYTYTLKSSELQSMAGEWKLSITTEFSYDIDIFVKARQFAG